MGKIVVGMYDELSDAQKAVDELKRKGFSSDDISLVAGDTRGEYGKYLKDRDSSTVEDTSDGAAAGAGIGAVIGGLGGLLVGLGALAIPGIGPVIAAGPLVSALAGAGIGAAAGGLLGALVDAGIPEEQAELYTEGVRRGSTLVTVRSADDRASQAVDILNRHNPIDVEQRSREWRQSGWTGKEMPTQTSKMTQTSDEEMSRRETHREGEVTFPVVEEDRTGDKDRMMSDDFAEYEPFFRSDYDNAYTMSGYTYDTYEPAYRYGYDLAHDNRYHGWDWGRLENSARQDWETRYPDSAWEQFKDAVQTAWERVKDSIS